jgi:hypothetical protein
LKSLKSLQRSYKVILEKELFSSEKNISKYPVRDRDSLKSSWRSKIKDLREKLANKDKITMLKLSFLFID